MKPATTCARLTCNDRPTQRLTRAKRTAAGMLYKQSEDLCARHFESTKEALCKNGVDHWTEPLC